MKLEKKLDGDVILESYDLAVDFFYLLLLGAN